MLEARSLPLRRRHGEAVAITSKGRIFSAGSIMELARLFAGNIGEFAASRGGNSAIAHCIVLPSSDPALFLAGLVGCRLAGAIAVPWRDSAGPPDAIADVVRPTAIATLRADGMELEAVNEISVADPRFGDLIMMTSGSTGQPKGVALSLEKVMLNAVAAGSIMEVWKCNAWSIDIDLSLMSAVSHTLMAWQFDLPLHHLSENTDDENERIFEERIGFGGSPIQLVRFSERLKNGRPPAMLVSSGDFLMHSMLRQVHAEFPEAQIHKLYGLTELGGRFCCMPHTDLIESPDAAGRPLPGFEARVKADSDEGVIEAKSPLLAAGYYLSGRPFAPIEQGSWFATGDVGSIDADGVVTIVGRSDDVLKVGGEKVDRHTIEAALATVLSKYEYCAIAVSHRLLGQCIALFVAEREALLPKWAEIVSTIRAGLPGRFVPALMYVVEGGLPRLPSGKIDREYLKQNHAKMARLC